MRRQGSNRSDRAAQGHRKPPSETTGEEKRFLIEHVKSGKRVVLHLKDGTRSEGIVRCFDERQIEIESDDQPPVVLPKSLIRYIEEL